MNLNTNTLELMKKLTQISAVSGNEVGVSKLLQSYYKKYTDEIIFDNLGSVFAVRRCGLENVPKVLVSGHMDEIGFLVQDITEKGLIKMLPLGSICNEGLIGQRVNIVNRKGEEFRGIIMSSSKDASKLVDIKNLVVDMGMSTKEEVLNLGIQLGDSIVVEGDFEILAGGKRLLSKAWNNRFGCVMGIEILEALKEEKLEVDLYVGATVQHEVGLRGAQTSTNLVQPDLGIVLDCLSANDVTGEKDGVGKLGEGVLINYYDKSMMPNRALLNCLVETCKEKNIKHQYYFSLGDGDNGWIHKLLRGCPTLTACICARNLQTNSGIIDANDYVAAKEAVISVIKSLNAEKVEAFKAENR
ncbi:MAG: M42 family peptidase [Clostridium cadaveris]|uniref:Glutamyl aminopeptidase n=1 Tax=Clostridium cadaveris TaxID=1529 RepID=A0A1I2KBE0_9CLOT|nr:M42 family peptidase [Clostridium cadaveris]MDM8310910.1 M42 family peptidase [Clostridium cadaveris]MDY4947947.1 M42 family peptidase [Clostridium cadaveris]SFF62421.1 glutamyl aminopeptidase [Clostridium cadaveris]